MKKKLLVMAVSCLVIGSIVVSCKKSDDKEDVRNATNPTTTTSTTGSSPITSKEGHGTASVEVNGVKESMNAMEAILPPLNYFGIYSSGDENSLDISTGDKKLPSGSKLYMVLGDPSKEPSGSEAIINYYDGNSKLDYYATGGTIMYTITSTEKTVKFSNVTFTTEDNAHSKTISYEVSLK